MVRNSRTHRWILTDIDRCWPILLVQQVWRTCFHIFIAFCDPLRHGWVLVGLIVMCLLPCWKVFAGAFKRPSFGNGEAPLWLVAVRVSGRFNLSCHRINFHVGENQDCSSKVCISCERVRLKPPCLPWCMQKMGPCTLVHYQVTKCWLALLELATFWLLFIVRCCVHGLACMPWLWGLVTLHRLSGHFLLHCGIVPSRMTAIFNPFSEALRPPQIAEMCCLVRSGCIGRYGQWAWVIRHPFSWLGQRLLSTRREVAGWNLTAQLSQHVMIMVQNSRTHRWILTDIDRCWPILLVQQVWRTCFHIFIAFCDPLRHGWVLVGLIVICLLPCWKVFAGAFKRPSFGNGEAPLWLVAVRVSGRFNLSCHRINFHVGENQDCSSKVCISCERVRPKPPCLPWCMQKMGPCTLVHYQVTKCWLALLELATFRLLFIVRCCVHGLACMPWLWGLVTLHPLSGHFLVHCGIVPSRMTAIFNPFSEALRPPQIAEMCCLVCSGCIGRYGQWAWVIRHLFSWLGQRLLSTRREVAGWNLTAQLSQHVMIMVRNSRTHRWILTDIDRCWPILLVQQVWRTCFHIFIAFYDPLRHGWVLVGLIVMCLLPCWKVFAGAFKRPSFGNGEAPLWLVAVRVSGRFNLSCHRINFHVGENQDCSSKVCISCERVRPKPPCLPWCMQKWVLVHLRTDWTWRTFHEDILMYPYLRCNTIGDRSNVAAASFKIKAGSEKTITFKLQSLAMKEWNNENMIFLWPSDDLPITSITCIAV